MVRVMIRKLVAAVTLGALSLGAGAARASALTFQGPVQVRVNRGETLWQIAQRNGVSLADMIRMNNMLNPDRILAGANLFLPYPVSPKLEQYSTQGGDTPASIAARFATSLNSIYAQNTQLKQGAPIMVGQSLQISRGPEAICPEGQSCLQTYAVMPGDTLGSIAWTARVNMNELARVNNLKDYGRITVGQTLIIPRTRQSTPPTGGVTPPAPAPTPVTAFTGWANEQGDAGRSGYNPTATMGAQARLLWTSPVKVGLFRSPSGIAAGDGMLFVGSTDKHLYAVSPDTGAVIWTTQLEGEWGVGYPAYDPVHKLVFATTDGFPDGHIHAVDAKTGTVRWSAKTGGQWSAGDASPVVEGNSVFVAANGGGTTLYAFDVETGRQLWTLSGDSGEVPAISRGKIFTSYLSGWIRAARTSDGSRLWSTGGGWSGGGRYATMVVGNRVFAISEEYDLYVVAKDTETGKELWRRTDERIRRGGTLASDGSLLWVPVKGGVMALDSATGAIVREVTLFDPGTSGTQTEAPVIGKSHLFVPANGKIWAIDRQSFAVTELAAGMGPLALVGDRLYFLTMDESNFERPLGALQAVTK